MSVKNASPIAHYRHLSFGQRVVRDWKLNKWKLLDPANRNVFTPHVEKFF